MTEMEVIVLITFFFVPTLAIFVNFAEIWILAKKRRWMTNNERILLSLSIADLLVGITFVVFHAVQIRINKIWLKMGSGYLLWFSIMVSCFHIVYMTADRCIAVVFPFKHRILVTTSRTNYCTFWIWMGSGAVMAVLITNATQQITRTVLGYVINVTVILMIFTYGVIIYKVVIQRRRLQRVRDNRQGNTASSMKKDCNLVIMCVLIATTFAALTLPFSIKTVAHEKETFPERIAVVFNSLTNPFIYFFWRYLERRNENHRPTQVEMN